MEVIGKIQLFVVVELRSLFPSWLQTGAALISGSLSLVLARGPPCTRELATLYQLLPLLGVSLTSAISLCSQLETGLYF